MINGRPFENYFPVEELRFMVNKPFLLTGNVGKFDVVANIYGGGIPAQAWALGHGIAKALLEVNAGSQGSLEKTGPYHKGPEIKRTEEIRKERRTRQLPVLQEIISCTISELWEQRAIRALS